MSKEVEIGLLHRHWFRSESEGEIDKLVFRPADYPFPPRRMPRESLVIKENGTLEVGSPGTADKSVMTVTKWLLKDDELTITGPTKMSGRYQVLVLNEQMLVLRRCD